MNHGTNTLAESRFIDFHPPRYFFPLISPIFLIKEQKCKEATYSSSLSEAIYNGCLHKNLTLCIDRLRNDLLYIVYYIIYLLLPWSYSSFRLTDAYTYTYARSARDVNHDFIRKLDLLNLVNVYMAGKYFCRKEWLSARIGKIRWARRVSSLNRVAWTRVRSSEIAWHLSSRLCWQSGVFR